MAGWSPVNQPLPPLYHMPAMALPPQPLAPWALPVAPSPGLPLPSTPRAFIPTTPSPSNHHDVYTRWPLRGGGFLNELGTATQYLLGPSLAGSFLSGGWLALTWAGTIAYVAMHALNRGITQATTLQQEILAKAPPTEQAKWQKTAHAHGVKEGMVTLGYQSIASLFGPIYLIELFQHGMANAFEKAYGQQWVHQQKSQLGPQKAAQFISNALQHRFGYDTNEAQQLANKLLPLARPKPSNLGEFAKTMASGGLESMKKPLDFLLEPFQAFGRTLQSFAKAPQIPTHTSALLKELGNDVITHQAKGLSLLEHFGSPSFKLALLKVAAAGAAVGLWCVAIDPLVEKFKEEVLVPLADLWTNQYLQKQGLPTYTPNANEA